MPQLFKWLAIGWSLLTMGGCFAHFVSFGVTSGRMHPDDAGLGGIGIVMGWTCMWIVPTIGLAVLAWISKA